MSEDVKSIQGMPVINEVIDPTEELKAAEEKYAKESGKEIKDVYYTDEELKSIVSGLGFNDDKYVYTVPDCFKKLSKEKQPIFKFYAMNGEIQENFYDFAFTIKDNNGNPVVTDGNSLLAACRINKEIRKWLIDNLLVDWRNYRDNYGVEIKYNKENIDKILPVTIRMDLAEFALTSYLVDEDEKLSLEF